MPGLMPEAGRGGGAEGSPALSLRPTPGTLCPTGTGTHGRKHRSWPARLARSEGEVMERVEEVRKRGWKEERERTKTDRTGEGKRSCPTAVAQPFLFLPSVGSGTITGLDPSRSFHIAMFCTHYHPRLRLKPAGPQATRTSPLPYCLSALERGQERRSRQQSAGSEE